MSLRRWSMAIVATSMMSASALGQAPVNDVKCLLLSNAFARTGSDAKAKQIAQTATLFYGARVSALPAAQARTAFVAQRKLITPATAGPEMTSCARAMESSLRSLQALSASSASPAR